MNNCIFKKFAFCSKLDVADMAVAWQGLPASTQIEIMNYVHERNAIVLVACGGSTESPYNSVSGSNYGTAVYKYYYL